ncbi:DNA methyltransferase family protein [Rubrivivax gelatinosus]|uniref:SAM-dependent methyltransferase n=1 Tax=Rubrivivax gelatinosus TaxID=28068 RepID=UPI0002E512B9|nr:SAM-dependent methyltransferase [Rubrivivax gelatinosus]MBG6083083.1 site-specific DNA-methyltransferase (adenine-specific) [Rubrivivax gelatinosus]
MDAYSHARRDLGQYFTPRWAAEAIVERHFADLAPGCTVVEPSCGDGVFLHALPAHVNAIGVEIDPRWAAKAQRDTGRTVLQGDFLQVSLPIDVEAIVGNPPFNAAIVSRFLERAHTLLGENGRCGLILPAYVMQTSSKVMAMAERWSVAVELMPRNLFPGLSLPLVFSLFTKERERRLFGLFLYPETAGVAEASKGARAVLERSARGGSVWRQAVHDAFDLVADDVAPLDALYRALEGRRPTPNPHFRAKVRQTLQLYSEFEPVERGVWRRSSGEVVEA